MRLWTLSPIYLDNVGLSRCYHEGLTGLRALLKIKKGYFNHPELHRFKNTCAPTATLSAYLCNVHAEAQSRGKVYNCTLLNPTGPAFIPVNRAQIEFEINHIKDKLWGRYEVAKTSKTKDHCWEKLLLLTEHELKNSVQLNKIFYREV